MRINLHFARSNVTCRTESITVKGDIRIFQISLHKFKTVLLLFRELFDPTQRFDSRAINKTLTHFRVCGHVYKVINQISCWGIKKVISKGHLSHRQVSTSASNDYPSEENRKHLVDYFGRKTDTRSLIMFVKIKTTRTNLRLIPP